MEASPKVDREDEGDVAALPHPETAEIIRQVEYYFSDQNLPHDAHLLELTGGDGNGAVSFGHIHCFKKMRRFKPRSRVLASLRQSTSLEIVEKKFIKRRIPLTLPIMAVKRTDCQLNEKAEQLKQKPWLTKGMLRPTGFEDNFAEGPLSPEDHEQEQKLFDPEEHFVIRIERAVGRYCSKRKMHQLVRHIFTQYLIFSGFDGKSRLFTSGPSMQEAEEYDKDQIEAMKITFTVLPLVFDGLDHDRAGGPTWVVDFETSVKGFLSSAFLQTFDWHDSETVTTAVKLIRNFYNYLEYHNVCPEYGPQLTAVRKVCDVAGEELPKLSLFDKMLPGQFNIACSTLHGGSYASDNSHPTWANDTDQADQLSPKQAWQVLAAALFAYGTEEQIASVESAAASVSGLPPFKATFSPTSIGLEVVGIERLSDNAASIYCANDSPFSNTFLRPVGRLHCKFWNIPQSEPLDMPREAQAELASFKHENYSFIVEDEALQHCRPGMKLEAVVGELDLGVHFLDHVDAIYPTFFTWTMNEIIQDWKDPGPPKEWMLRQVQRRQDAELVQNGDASIVSDTNGA